MGKKIQCIGRYALEGHLLGKGSFARVELAHHSVTGCKVAIKIIDTRKLKEEYQKNNVQRESRILGQLRHPNIVRLYETLKATTLHCLVMEYASGGELQAFIKLQKDFRLSEDRGRPYIRQLVSALHYLHERGVAHRDLKMENIMLDTPKKNIKMVDFGLSNTFSKDELMKTHCGSPEYAAPELFTPGEKYGLEIDIWSFGIVMYAMLVGKLPFTTPYTDQYRRQKLVQQMEKGLVDVHHQEMAHLSADCQDLLQRVIEPSPSLRLPLLDMEIHSWITENGKKPFFPFGTFPRDKNMKTQLQDSMTSLEEDETLEELATALGMKKEILEQKVAENKSDEYSAMFNMILDRKRQQQGIYDVDHTLKCEKKEPKKRSKSAHSANKKGPPALVLSTDDSTDPTQHSAIDTETETKFSSFDFLALCSTPTWLGPERRKSRRRSRSPMPSPHIQQHGTQGLSVRNQMKRDYMERQAMEIEREMLREERAAAAGLLSPNSANQCSPTNNDHPPVGASLSVPGSEPSNSQLAIRRSSSFKLSRRRARSCGPSHRPKGTYQRSGSIDHRPEKEEASHLATSLAHSKEGSSAPVIVGEDILRRGTTKTSSLKIRSAQSGSISRRKGSVDFDLRIQNPNTDITKKSLLTVPTSEPKKHFLEVPEVEHQNKNYLTVPCLDMGSNPQLCVSQDEIFIPSEDSLSSISGSKSVTRPDNLTLRECYPTLKEDSNKSNVQLLPQKPTLSGLNGPLTNVEVHYIDSSNPSSSTDLLRTQGHSSLKLDSLDLPIVGVDMSNGSNSSDFFSLDMSDNQPPKSTPSEKIPEVKAKHQRLKPRLTQSESTPSSSLLRPLNPNTNHMILSNGMDGGIKAMQIGQDEPLVLCNATENSESLLLGAECSFVHSNSALHDEISDLHDTFDGLILSSDGFDENDDRVDSMTELISESFRHEIMVNTKSSGSTPIGIGATQKISRPNSVATPEDDLLMSSRKGSSSAASRSSKSGSSRKQGSGKVKSPTTPMWLNLKTPLARIESFHSDDFDNLRDSDNEDKGSSSSMSVTTPTVPCFAYKLHMMKKKQSKLKNKNSNIDNNCSPLQNNDYIMSKTNRCSSDRKHLSLSPGRHDVTDPLLSSGSETEHHDDCIDRVGVPGKSKVHPIILDDRDTDLLSKSDTKCLPYTNAITRQPNQIKNSISSKITASSEGGGKKKSFTKNMAWRKSFAQFLKRKKYHHGQVITTPPQQQYQHHLLQRSPMQQPSPGNNNNNDFSHGEPLPRNGTTVLVNQPQSKVTDVSTGTEIATTQDLDNLKLATTTLSSVPVENSIIELIELQSSPKLHCSSSPTSRVFDFTLASESPKMKTSCLLSWGSCRDCGRSDISSEEDFECFTTQDPTAIGLSMIPIGENNIQENINFLQTCHLSPT
ncbi:serine/threonine-protein kinase par-1-like isoform X2 [Biomphalaria glabrata]|uniref:non-specific serine/threonine protein kinase n=1 Tax=Biomphalaria glabrata TaxID=6526 RepID=A0A9U8E3Q2_BIOGL|nr:serine/threonine-protein kinase par-1-like isoform X2 [Biomphalaria glabrata]